MGRTPTQEGLQKELASIGSYLQQLTRMIAPHEQRIGGLSDRVAVLEDTTGDDVIKFIREAGARYTEVHSAVATIADRVEDMNTQIAALALDVRRRVDDHDERIGVVAERAATHEVRLDAIDADGLDSRLRTVEAHVAGDARELALTKTQQRRLDGRAGVISAVAGGIVAAVAKLLGG